MQSIPHLKKHDISNDELPSRVLVESLEYIRKNIVYEGIEVALNSIEPSGVLMGMANRVNIYSFERGSHYRGALFTQQITS